MTLCRRLRNRFSSNRPNFIDSTWSGRNTRYAAAARISAATRRIQPIIRLPIDPASARRRNAPAAESVCIGSIRKAFHFSPSEVTAHDEPAGALGSGSRPAACRPRENRAAGTAKSPRKFLSSTSRNSASARWPCSSPRTAAKALLASRAHESTAARAKRIARSVRRPLLSHQFSRKTGFHFSARRVQYPSQSQKARPRISFSTRTSKTAASTPACISPNATATPAAAATPILCRYRNAATKAADAGTSPSHGMSAHRNPEGYPVDTLDRARLSACAATERKRPG